MSIVHPEHPSLSEPSAQAPFTEQLATWQGRNVSTLQPGDQKQLQEFCRRHIGEYTQLLSELEQKKVEEVTAQNVGAFYQTWSQAHQFKSCLERSNCVAYTKKGLGIVGAFFATWRKLGFKKAWEASYLHVANKDVVETRRGDVEKAVRRVFEPMGYTVSSSDDTAFSLRGHGQEFSLNPSRARDEVERATVTFRTADTQRKQQEVQRRLEGLKALRDTPLNSEEFTLIVPSEERTRDFVFYQPESAGVLLGYRAKKEGLLVQNPGDDSTREISFDSEEWHNMPPDEQLAHLSAVDQTKETYVKYKAIKTIRESDIGKTTDDASVESTLQEKARDLQFQNTYCLHSVAGEPYKRTLYLIKNNQLHTYNVDFSSGKIKATAASDGRTVEVDSFEKLIQELVGREVSCSSFSSRQGEEVRQVQHIKNSLLRQLNGVDQSRYQTARETCCRQIRQIHQYNSEKYSSSVSAFQLIQKTNGDLDLKTFQIKPDGQVFDEQSKPVVVNPNGRINYDGREYGSVQDLQSVLLNKQPLDAVEKKVKKDFEEAQAATIRSLRDVADLHVQDHDSSEVGQTFSQLQSLSTKRVFDPQDIQVPVVAVHINKKPTAGAFGMIARVFTAGHVGGGDDSLVISIIKPKRDGRGYELIRQAITCPAPGKYKVDEQEFDSLSAIQAWIAQQGNPIYPQVATLLQTVQRKHEALGFPQLPSAQDIERDRARCKKFFGEAALQHVWVLGKAKDAPRGSEKVCLYQGAQPGQLVHIHQAGYTVGDGAKPSDAVPAGQGCTLRSVTDVVDATERRMSQFESASCQVSGQTYSYFSSKILYKVGQEQSVRAQMEQVVQSTQHDCQLIVKDPTHEPPVYLFLEGECKDGRVVISSAQIRFEATIEGGGPRITERVDFFNVATDKQQGYIGRFLSPSVGGVDTYEHLLQMVVPSAKKAPKKGEIVLIQDSEYEGVRVLPEIVNAEGEIQEVLHPEEEGASSGDLFRLAQLCLAEIEETDQLVFSGRFVQGPRLAEGCEFKQLLSKISSDEELNDTQKFQMEKAIREKSKQSSLTKNQAKALIHLIFALGLRPGCLSQKIVSSYTSDINEIEKLYTEEE